MLLHIKDHKVNFANNTQVRLINPAKKWTWENK